MPPNWKPGGYLEKLPKDPWGRPYVYLNPGVRGEIDVFSFGADGQPGGTRHRRRHRLLGPVAAAAPRTTGRARPAGFTLVEILVVVVDPRDRGGRGGRSPATATIATARRARRGASPARSSTPRARAQVRAETLGVSADGGAGASGGATPTAAAGSRSATTTCSRAHALPARDARRRR